MELRAFMIASASLLVFTVMYAATLVLPAATFSHIWPSETLASVASRVRYRASSKASIGFDIVMLRATS